MNTNPANSQESTQAAQTTADLTNEMRNLTSMLDSLALSFTLAWRRDFDHQCQQSPITQAEKTTS